MDQFHHEQHAFIMAQQRAAAAAAARAQPDEETSWVMLADQGRVVRLDNERFLHTAPSLSLELSAPGRRAQGVASYLVKSSKGTAYITNRRLIYLPDKPTGEFKSFSAPILHCRDTHLTSPIFGPWCWTASVEAVPDGGVPTDFARVSLKLTFLDGGSSEFRERFEVIKGRLEHAVQLMRETGTAASFDNLAHDEQLPRYEATATTTAAGPSSSSGATAGATSSLPPPPAPAPTTTTSSSGGGAAATSTRPAAPTAGPSPSQPPPQHSSVPDEPPPDYDEAQAQAIGMRLDQHLRQEADRDGP